MSAWLQTITGRTLVFAAPEIAPEHLFTEIAPALAKINRFCGHTDVPYSVAQHSALMAECALAETDDPELAAFCLLHDAHEAFTGDRTSPMKAAEWEATVGRLMGFDRPEAQAIDAARDAAYGRSLVEGRLDCAILTAAGFADARYFARQNEVKTLDLRALLTERRDLLVRGSKPWDIDAIEPPLPPLRLAGGRIRPLPWPAAEELFIRLLCQLCPDAARAAGRA